MVALDVLMRRLSHYVGWEQISALRARIADRREAYLAIDDPEAFRAAVTADLQGVSGDRHLQVWIEPVSRDAPAPAGPAADPETVERGQNFGIRETRRLAGDIGYLDLAYFSGHPASATAIDAALAELAGSQALIVDLRRNGGGGEAALRRLIGHLAPQPLPLMTIHTRRCAPDPADVQGCLQDGSRDVQQRVADQIDAPAFPAQPIFILTSKGSFSAAEEFAYDLQHGGRAMVIGEVTGGGANPSITMDLGPWFTIIMPIAFTTHPVTGTNWDGVGVTPDVAVAADAALEEAIRRATARPG